MYGQIGDKFLIWWSSENLNDCNSRIFNSTEEWEQFYNFFYYIPDISDFHGKESVSANLNYNVFWLNYQAYDIGQRTTWIIDSTHGAYETVIVNDSGTYRRLLLDLGHPHADIDFDRYFMVFYRESGYYPGPYSSGGVPWPQRNITMLENNSDIAVIPSVSQCQGGCIATMQYVFYDSTRFGTYYSLSAFPKPAESKPLFSIKRTVAWDGSTGETISTDYEGAVYCGKVTGSAPIKIEQQRELKSADPVKVYPNPFHPSTTISVNLKGEKGDLRLQVFDITGKLVKSFGRAAQSPHLYTFDASGLPSGIYIIKAIIGKRQYNRKLVLR